MYKNFEIIFVSKSEYKCLVAEILFCNQRLCQISKEEGNEKMRILFFSDLYILNEKVEMEFYFDDFEIVLNKAKEELTLCEPV